MSQENVEVARRMLDAFNRVMDAHNRAMTFETRMAFFDQVTKFDFDILPAMAGSVESESYRGREGFERYVENLDDAWDELRLVGGEFRDLCDRVLWLGQLEGRGRGSGVPVASPSASLFEFRGGDISRNRSFLDHAEALRAVGLSK